MGMEKAFTFSKQMIIILWKCVNLL